MYSLQRSLFARSFYAAHIKPYYTDHNSRQCWRPHYRWQCCTCFQEQAFQLFPYIQVYRPPSIHDFQVHDRFLNNFHMFWKIPIDNVTCISKLVNHLVTQLPHPLHILSIFLFLKSNDGKLQALPGAFPILSFVVQGKVKLNIFECEKK